MDYQVGQRLHIISDGMYGEIRSIELTDDGEQIAIVLLCDDGQWARVEIADIGEPVTVH